MKRRQWDPFSSIALTGVFILQQNGLRFKEFSIPGIGKLQPVDQCGLLSVFIHKVLLEPSSVHLFAYCLGLLSTMIAALS